MERQRSQKTGVSAAVNVKSGRWGEELELSRRNWTTNRELTRKLRERSGRNDVVVDHMSWRGGTLKIVSLVISKEDFGMPSGDGAFVVVLIDNPSRECSLSSPSLLEEIANKTPLDELPA